MPTELALSSVIPWFVLSPRSQIPKSYSKQVEKEEEERGTLTDPRRLVSAELTKETLPNQENDRSSVADTGQPPYPTDCPAFALGWKAEDTQDRTAAYTSLGAPAPPHGSHDSLTHLNPVTLGKVKSNSYDSCSVPAQS